MESSIHSFLFQSDGKIPNNRALPVIIYQKVFQKDPEKIEETFHRHRWLGSWKGGVFHYHHYHSNSHEVLGVISGEATILLGGEKGKEFEVSVGDIVLLPAGVGHKRLESSANFQVVGAYPDGCDYNLLRDDPALIKQALIDIQKVPIPKMDPVYGRNGPLMKRWKRP